ncbi:hypothetical protein B9Z55_019647 [Caenorhabditis nigoni]|nr:hypothetical protein B9Z55_019647 [Caenorhabditis nigoni]
MFFKANHPSSDSTTSQFLPFFSFQENIGLKFLWSFSSEILRNTEKKNVSVWSRCLVPSILHLSSYNFQINLSLPVNVCTWKFTIQKTSSLFFLIWLSNPHPNSLLLLLNPPSRFQTPKNSASSSFTTTNNTTTTSTMTNTATTQEGTSSNRRTPSSSSSSCLIKCFLMERHYRHLVFSLSLHTLIYLLLHMCFSPRDLAQAFLADILILLLAAFGTARKLPLLIFPSVVVKFICFSLCAGVAMLSLSETSINMKTKEARMEFRRQRNYPEVVNVTFEDHPTVCIWIHAMAVVVALDLNIGLKAFYSSFDCMKKPVVEEEKPPSYTVCVTNSSQSTLPPSYEEALEARRNMQSSQIVPARKNHRNSGVFVV